MSSSIAKDIERQDKGPPYAQILAYAISGGSPVPAYQRTRLFSDATCRAVCLRFHLDCKMVLQVLTLLTRGARTLPRRSSASPSQRPRSNERDTSFCQTSPGFKATSQVLTRLDDQCSSAKELSVPGNN